MTGQSERNYTIRQGAYDLRKLRGKQLLDKPGRSRRYHVPDHAARTSPASSRSATTSSLPSSPASAAPASAASPPRGPASTATNEHLRITMQTLLSDLAIDTPAAA